MNSTSIQMDRVIERYVRYSEGDRLERNELFRTLDPEPYPANTGIQARSFRGDLRVEIETMAIVRHGGEK